MKRVNLSDQVFEALKSRIEAKIYPPNSLLPPIPALAEEFSVGRSTIREAVTQLESASMVDVRQGKGILVVETKIDFSSRLKSFTDSIREMGMEPGAIIQIKKVEIADSVVASKLKIAPNTMVNHIIRIRLADNLPMAVEASYSSLEVFPNLTEVKNLEGSLYRIFSDLYQRQVVYAIRTLRAVLPKPDEAKWLGIDRKLPALEIETVALDQDQHPLEFGKSIYRADRYQFVIHQTV